MERKRRDETTWLENARQLEDRATRLLAVLEDTAGQLSDFARALHEEVDKAAEEAKRKGHRDDKP